MAFDSAIREGSFPVNYNESVNLHPEKDEAGRTLLFSDPARSTKLIFPVNANSAF